MQQPAAAPATPLEFGLFNNNLERALQVVKGSWTAGGKAGPGGGEAMVALAQNEWPNGVALPPDVALPRGILPFYHSMLTARQDKDWKTYGQLLRDAYLYLVASGQAVPAVVGQQQQAGPAQAAVPAAVVGQQVPAQPVVPAAAGNAAVPAAVVGQQAPAQAAVPAAGGQPGQQVVAHPANALEVALKTYIPSGSIPAEQDETACMIPNMKYINLIGGLGGPGIAAADWNDNGFRLSDEQYEGTFPPVPNSAAVGDADLMPGQFWMGRCDIIAQGWMNKAASWGVMGKGYLRYVVIYEVKDTTDYQFRWTRQAATPPFSSGGTGFAQVSNALMQNQIAPQSPGIYIETFMVPTVFSFSARGLDQYRLHFRGKKDHIKCYRLSRQDLTGKNFHLTVNYDLAGGRTTFSIGRTAEQKAVAMANSQRLEAQEIAKKINVGVTENGGTCDSDHYEIVYHWVDTTVDGGVADSTRWQDAFLRLGITMDDDRSLPIGGPPLQPQLAAAGPGGAAGHGAAAAGPVVAAAAGGAAAQNPPGAVNDVLRVLSVVQMRDYAQALIDGDGNGGAVYDTLMDVAQLDDISLNHALNGVRQGNNNGDITIGEREILRNAVCKDLGFQDELINIIYDLRLQAHFVDFGHADARTVDAVVALNDAQLDAVVGAGAVPLLRQYIAGAQAAIVGGAGGVAWHFVPPQAAAGGAHGNAGGQMAVAVAPAVAADAHVIRDELWNLWTAEMAQALQADPVNGIGDLEPIRRRFKARLLEADTAEGQNAVWSDARAELAVTYSKYIWWSGGINDIPAANLLRNQQVYWLIVILLNEKFPALGDEKFGDVGALALQLLDMKASAQGQWVPPNPPYHRWPGPGVGQNGQQQPATVCLGEVAGDGDPLSTAAAVKTLGPNFDGMPILRAEDAQAVAGAVLAAQLAAAAPPPPPPVVVAAVPAPPAPADLCAARRVELENIIANSQLQPVEALVNEAVTPGAHQMDGQEWRVILDNAKLGPHGPAMLMKMILAKEYGDLVASAEMVNGLHNGAPLGDPGALPDQPQGVAWQAGGGRKRKSKRRKSKRRKSKRKSTRRKSTRKSTRRKSTRRKSTRRKSKRKKSRSRRR